MTAYDRSTLIAALLRAPLKNSDTVKLITRAELARLGIYERYPRTFCASLLCRARTLWRAGLDQSHADATVLRRRISL
jgi:hypothetical protein